MSIRLTLALPKGRGVIPRNKYKYSRMKCRNDTTGKTFTSIPAGKVDLELQTSVKTPQDLPPGIYNYKATLTIVP
jgi:hypothetical protein